MPPLIPRRRRSRRRPWSGRIVVVVCGLLALAIVIGGLIRISNQSGHYDASLNRSFAAAGGVVADQSSVTGTELRRLMATMPTQSRRSLQAQLDSIVEQAGRESVQAASVAGTGGGGVRDAFVAAFTDRAAASVRVRAALDGLLGMHPLPVAGTRQGGGTGAAAPTLLSASAAADRLESAGALLIRSDASLSGARRALARAAGHARLPASTWVAKPSTWQGGAIDTVIADVAASPTLAATHHLELRTVRLSPQALPSPSGTVTPGTSTLSPTKRLGVSVVVSNQGSVDEPHASVQFTLTSLSSGLTSTVTRSVAIASDTSVALDPVLFAVKPGQDYRITVAIVLPAAQTDITNTSQTEELDIAPGT
jgi:hypothetical protein